MVKTLTFVLIGLLAAATVQLQASTRRKTNNAKSPSAEASMTLDGKTIAIEYNAPSARERAVEGGLIPYGKVWRTGADAATTLITPVDLMIGSLRVPAGEVTLYTLAGENDWKLIVNKQTGQWGLTYNEAQDLGRVPLTLTKLSAPVEKFKIELKDGAFQMEWGTTQASVPVKLAK